MITINNNFFKSIHKVLSFATPISAGLFINMISSFIAMMMVAKLGELELAAGALAISTNLTIMTVLATFFYAIGISISHLRGQQKSHHEIGVIIKNGLWLALCLAIPGCILLWNIDLVLIFFKQNPELIKITTNYFHFASLAIFPSLINTVFFQFFTGTNRPRFTMFISLISLPMTILFSYLLILGHFGFTQLGLAGMSDAIFITQTILTIGVFTYLKLGKSNHQYKIFSGNSLPSWSICKNIIFLGLPIGIQFGAELAAMTISTYFMGYFGIMALAASQITSQYSLLAVMVTIGLSQAISVLTSEAYGAQNDVLIKRYMIATIVILTIFFLGIFLLFVGFPTDLINIFVNKNENINSDMIYLTTQFFEISAITLFVDGIRNIFSGILRGLHDSKTPMLIGVICLWAISLPMNYLFGFTFHGGPIGLRFGFMSGFIIAALILWLRIKKKINSKDLKVSYQPN